MSFRRSILRMAERSDVQPGLKKVRFFKLYIFQNIFKQYTQYFLQLWKKYYKVDGQVTQHLSPFEQNVVSPMFKDWHNKVLKRLTTFLMEAGPGLGFGIFVFYWAEAKYKDIAYHHRS